VGRSDHKKKINNKHNELRENPERKKPKRGREKFHYINDNYRWDFMDSDPPPFHVGRNFLFIQIVSVLIRLGSPTQFKHLTAYLRCG